MADIVLGIGTSHTPMLYTEPDHWTKYETRDRKMTLLDHEGNPRAFDELVAAAGPEVAEALAPDAIRQAYDTCQENLDRLADTLAEVAPDAIIIIGDDQKELFQVENLPAILVYIGDTIVNRQRRPKPGEPTWWSDALSKYYGDGRDETCPVEGIGDAAGHEHGRRSFRWRASAAVRSGRRDGLRRLPRRPALPGEHPPRGRGDSKQQEA